MPKLKATVASIILLFILFYSPAVEILGQPLVVKDQPQKADAIVILGGGWAKNGKLSATSLDRYRYGMKLYQKGLANYIFFSGGKTSGDFTEAEAMENLAIEEGFSEQVMFTETDSQNTLENAILLKPLLTQNKVKSVILVTSSYHSFRAKKALEEAGVRVISLPAPESNQSTESESGENILGEYFKSAFYTVAYAIDAF